MRKGEKYVKRDIRGELLKLLSDGLYHSGESAGEALNITRSAVWKYMKELREEGIIIHAIKNRGYCLAVSEDDLQPDMISAKARGRYGKAVRFEDTTDSTHRMAKDWVLSAPHGSVCIAEVQTAGRGRMSRGWYSPRFSGLWMSVIVKPKFPPGNIQALTMLAAVCVCRAIERTYIDPENQAKSPLPLIKWPNDIVINGKKVCGILLEMSAFIDKVDWVIISSGINVRFQDNGTPEAREIENIAAFLEREYSKPVLRKELLWNYLEELENAIGLWTSGSTRGIIDAYLKRSVTLGQAVNATSPEFEVSGIAEKIDDNGVLWIKTESGELKRIIAGDVSVRGVMGYV